MSPKTIDLTLEQAARVDMIFHDGVKCEVCEGNVLKGGPKGLLCEPRSSETFDNPKSLKIIILCQPCQKAIGDFIKARMPQDDWEDD